MNSIKDQIMLNAGAKTKQQVLKEEALDYEKRKIQVKTRALNIVLNILNDIDYLKKDIIRPYIPMYNNGPTSQEVPEINPDEIKALKKICYSIFKDKFATIEETIEKDFGEKVKEE